MRGVLTLTELFAVCGLPPHSAAAKPQHASTIAHTTPISHAVVIGEVARAAVYSFWKSSFSEDQNEVCTYHLFASNRYSRNREPTAISRQ
jgi:hypothetical protein